MGSQGADELATASARTTALRTVVRDGWYNAFTDLATWKGYYWLAYRRGTYHNQVRTASTSMVLRSDDLRRWTQAVAFLPPGGIADGSGAHRGILVPTEDRLYLYMPVQTPLANGSTRASSLGGRIYVTWTDDGVTWAPHQLVHLGDRAPYFWRVREFDGKFYLATSILDCAQGAEAGPLQLLVSDDGISFTSHAQIGPPQGEENDLYLCTDGQMWCVARSRQARMYWADPPYTEWQGDVELDGWIHAPAICATGDQVYVAGRALAGRQPLLTITTGLWRLVRGRAKLLVTFEIAQDCSYPGLISLEPGKLAMSYYSDGIYATGLRKPEHFDSYQRKHSDSDIYLAEIEVTS